MFFTGLSLRTGASNLMMLGDEGEEKVGIGKACGLFWSGILLGRFLLKFSCRLCEGICCIV